jgi:aspartate aminotransferase
MQTVSGTGANHIAAQFLSTKLWPKTVWISNPSWINYTEIWRLADPNIQQRFYPYFDKESQGVDFDGMVETLRKEASSGDAVVLQACAHNPTGVDLTEQQWDVIATICKEVGLFVVFDLA